MNCQKHIIPIHLIDLLSIFILVHMLIPIGSSRCLSALNITSVSPNSYRNHTPTEILLHGSGFTLDSELHLYQSNLGQAVIEDTPGKAYAIAVSGDYAYLADLEKGLQIIDLSTASRPRLIVDYKTPGKVYDVAISGNYAYVANFAKGFHIVDIIDPLHPKKASKLNWTMH